jgi:sterol desaturase/sphingolipid hydroxylase (fatty acid hydroxylase superfamily)
MTDMQNPQSLDRTSEHRLRRALTELFRDITQNQTNYRVSYAVDLACPLMLIYFGLRQADDWRISLVSFLVGLFIFSLVEYAIHRWLFHSPRSFMTPIHQTHHVAPQDPLALPFFTSAGVALILWSALSTLLEQQIVCLSIAGLMLGYFCYASLHHMNHHTRINFLPLQWLKRRWAAHGVHHHLFDRNYGVTTSLWDRVFGTDHRPGQVQRRTR